MNLKESINSVQEDILPKFDPSNDILYQKQSTLRTLVGILGMLLPLLLWVLLYLHNGNTAPLDSISHYYYTRVGTVFTIVVSLLSVFLLVYQGFEMLDNLLASIAGVSSLLLLYFPTSNILCTSELECSSIITVLVDVDLRIRFHFIMAGFFLISLALLAIFLFTKQTGDEKGFVLPEFTKENILFIICGLLMFLSIVLIWSNVFGIFSDLEYKKRNLTFWFEVLALESFGLAWLVKGLKKTNKKFKLV